VTGVRSRLHEVADRVRRGDPLPPHWDLALRAATPAMRAGMWLRFLQKTEHVDARVVSFGNLTAGGTGKTPAVIERAVAELESGRRVAVLTRGYGSGASHEQVAVDTAAPVLEPRPWLGDEPELIARRAPGVVIVRGRNRVAGARLAVESFGCDLLLMDDGYQYLRLARDENICLIDATNPFGNGHLLPRGILREPVEALARATQFVLTRCDQAGILSPTLDLLRSRFPETPVRLTRHAPTHLWRVSTGENLPLECLRAHAVTAVCAIGSPESFRRTLEGLGARVDACRFFRDHAHVPAEALLADGWVVTTEKDAVRTASPPDNVLALAVSLRDLGESGPAA
jgi:tetraacyldisaccharide 4'-kinase